MASLKDIIPNHLTIFVLLVFVSTTLGAASVDIDGSGMVDFNDLMIMQDYWLDTGPVADIAGPDGNSDGIVDEFDFAVLGQNWLNDTNETIAALIAEATEFADQQIWDIHATWSNYNTLYPKQTQHNESDPNNHYAEWDEVSNSDWTCGFFAGCMMHMYELTGDSNYLDAVETDWLPGLESGSTSGYRTLSSFGNAYRLTGDPNYLTTFLQAATSQVTRFNAQIGCIGDYRPDNEFRVIVDLMPQMELFFFGAKNGGDPNWYDKALSHSLKSAQDHVRDDGTTYHRLHYDLDDPCGETFRPVGNPGYSAYSCWSRGQAWAVYGFTMSYRETNDPNLLAAAQQVADYFVDNLPPDFVPFYDFMDPNIPNTIRDSSAASIAAAGLLELSTLVEDPNYQQKYYQAAKNILVSLCTRDSNGGYLAKDAAGNPLSPTILMKGYKQYGYTIIKLYERGTSWGDYYFLHALLRYRDMLGQ